MRKLAYALVGLLALLADAPERRDPIAVETGHLAYSNGRSFISRYFYGCSAVVVDCGNKAVFAHAMPPVRPNSEDAVNVYNVARKIDEEIRNRTMNKDRCEAIINAGGDQYLGILVRDISERGIRIRRADNGNNGFARDVFYDPLTNELVVYYNTLPQDYSESNK